MNIVLISECSGNALAQTRRILDQFSERRGERVWQTTITLAGLTTLRRMLRKKARKNTAVACYRLYGAQTELLWIVGTASRFNERGAVPTNRTRRNILRLEDENTWHSHETIFLLSSLAALWHDLGKSCAQFQRILRSSCPERNLIRHEWISLRLFEAFIGKEKDKDWLQRMADFQPELAEKTLAQVHRDVLVDLSGSALKPFEFLPPLARAVGWLILSHHRLPTNPEQEISPALLHALPQNIVRRWNESETPEQERVKEYWNIPPDIFTRLGPDWQKNIRKCAARFLNHPTAEKNCLDPFVLHLSRLTLMLADHKVSAQHTKKKKESLPNKDELFANTDRDKKLKQTLAEHLLQVSKMCGQIAYALPAIAKDFPRLARHRGLRRCSKNIRFRWQDKAVEACAAIRQQQNTGGVFLLNMASTGCGKTLANIRMIYALFPPEKGMRATFALGLRVLTTQTGREYQKRLHLFEDELAVQTGGLAARELYDLFSYHTKKTEKKYAIAPEEQKIFEKNWRELAEQGQESARGLFADDTHVLFEGNTEHPILKKIVENRQAKKFLSAPILTCTVDHLVPATESLRGGHQILPMLRLLGSDLVLDEIDDYGLEDLPAIARLIYWAGMLGCRVLISSATMPPALATGLFTAYSKGRTVFERNLGQQPNKQLPIICVWTDEFGTHVEHVADEKNFALQHKTFANNRANRIRKDTHRRTASLLDIESLVSCRPRKLPENLARTLLASACRLHADNHSCIDEKRVSFGLLRMANIRPLRQIAQALCSLKAPKDTRIHLLVYHSRFPLAVRTKIEALLDRCLNRKDPLAVFNQPEIRSHLQSSEPDHIFLVLASPVCEVGRDWDADWAIVEPSSMRSLIQIAGRIRRHRPEKWEKTNIMLWSRNFKALTALPEEPAYMRPGFETRKGRGFSLRSHFLGDLLLPEEYEQPDSRPRLLEKEHPDPKGNLTDLEHARLRHLFIGEKETIPAYIGAFSWWQQPQSMLTGVLQQTQTFRRADIPQIECLLLPDETETDWILTAIHKNKESSKQRALEQLKVVWGQGMDAWIEINIIKELYAIEEQTNLPLATCARKFLTLSLPKSDIAGWTFHPLLGFDSAH